VEHGSFAAAAKALGYTPSAVSQQIAELERAAGLPLLQRRPVRTTEAGLVALAAAATADEALAAAETELRALRQGHAGHVRLGTFGSAASAIVAPALALYATERPGVTVTVVQIETPPAYAALITGDLDLAITFDQPPPEPVPQTITRTLLLTDPVLAALPATHPRAANSQVALSELAAERWITAPNAGAPNLLEELDPPPTIGACYDGEDFAVVLAFVAAGLGVALVPALATRALPDGAVVRPLSDFSLNRDVYISRLHTRHIPPAVAALQTILSTSRLIRTRPTA
jgi:DNA-binding transcriptional LysR family regulator